MLPLCKHGGWRFAYQISREDLLASSVALIQLLSGQPFRLMIERVMALQARNIWLIGWSVQQAKEPFLAWIRRAPCCGRADFGWWAAQPVVAGALVSSKPASDNDKRAELGPLNLAAR